MVHWGGLAFLKQTSTYGLLARLTAFVDSAVRCDLSRYPRSRRWGCPLLTRRDQSRNKSPSISCLCFYLIQLNKHQVAQRALSWNKLPAAARYRLVRSLLLYGFKSPALVASCTTMCTLCSSMMAFPCAQGRSDPILALSLPLKAKNWLSHLCTLPMPGLRLTYKTLRQNKDKTKPLPAGSV